MFNGQTRPGDFVTRRAGVEPPFSRRSDGAERPEITAGARPGRDDAEHVGLSRLHQTAAVANSLGGRLDPAIRKRLEDGRTAVHGDRRPVRAAGDYADPDDPALPVDPASRALGE